MIVVAQAVTDPGEARASRLFALRETRLRELAQRALNRGLRPRDVIIVCLEVDSSWRELVDELMLGYDWQLMRDRGESPIAQGSVIRSPLNRFLSELVPGIAAALRQPLPSGHFHAVVCVDDYASVFLITPKEEPS
jgi:hypothetical protein